MNHIIYLSSIIPLAAAIPTHSVSVSSNCAALLPVLLTILFILILLGAFKLLFKRSRQSWFQSLNALTPTSAPPGIIEKLLSKVAHSQPGFLVGFLGSPTWETTITLAVHKTLREQRRSFFATEPMPCTGYKCLHPGCSNYTLKESTVTGNACRRPHPSFSFRQVLELSSPAYMHQSKEGMEAWMPRPLPQALFNNLRTTPQRRYSFPFVTRSNVQLAHIRRSYSTKEKRRKHSKPGIDTVFIAPPPSPKIPDESVKHIFPLSFSPLLGCSKQYTKLSSPIMKTSSASPSPSIPSLALRTDNLWNFTDRASQQCFSTVEDSMASFALIEADCQSPLLSRKTAIPLFDGCTTVNLDDETLSTLPPINSVAMFNLRPRHRILSIRTKRSPPLGPSPLRRMILPESSDSDLSSKADCESSTILLKEDICNSLPNTGHDPTSDKRTASNWVDSKPIEDNDPDPLLGLIRELVEEVNDWDKSLFMDENFKTMIEKSQDTPSRKDQGRLSITQLHVINPCLEDNHAFEDKEKEILLPQDIGSDEYPILSGGGQLISFLEEGPEDSRTDDIGIAR